MAKKAKKSILASVMTSAAITADVAVSEASNESKFSENSEKIEIKEDIIYDDVCDKNEELSRLSKENSVLTDKIAAYIDEISSLKEELKKIKD